ncbi:MAG: chemotaxis protein CheD [Sterolibacterium sp.]|nr:chemotaxis protein CheD [Sterolibacterium sp.]
MNTRKEPTSQELERTAQTIHPGEWRVDQLRPIATLLGSCIAVCLYDPKLKFGGMNHFLLPNSDPNKAQDDLLRGDYSMEVLVNAMMAKGAQKKRLRAKVFGGGNPVSAISLSIGERNAQFASEWLAREGIAVDASDVGGPWSRKLLFDPHSGIAWCKRILGHLAISGDVARKEAEYARSLNKPAPSAEKKIELF